MSKRRGDRREEQKERHVEMRCWADDYFMVQSNLISVLFGKRNIKKTESDEKNISTSINEKIIMFTCLVSPFFPLQSKEAAQWIQE